MMYAREESAIIRVTPEEMHREDYLLVYKSERHFIVCDLGKESREYLCLGMKEDS